MSNKVFKDLKISEEVLASLEVADTYTPDSGRQVTVNLFKAELPYSLNTAAKIIWDYGGAGETVLWSLRGSGEFVDKLIIDSSEVDGVKKIAITCDNGEALQSLLMSAFAKLEID